jgi:hypothetical protein
LSAGTQEDGSRRQLLISAGLVILVIVLLFALVDVGAVVEMLLVADWRVRLRGNRPRQPSPFRDRCAR